MEYDRLSKSYTYGLAKIYEMVINNNPCYAYLLEGNALVDQKLVMAHVCAHNDFFKNNRWFSHTNRSMIDEMANHGSRVRSYQDRFGVEPVEEFIEVCFSLDNLIDIHSPYIKRRDDDDDEAGEEARPTAEVPKFKSKSYMQKFINPPDVLKAEEERLLQEKAEAAARFPQDPERDVMLFLLEHAPLSPWQQAVLEMLREEAYYFTPQGQTKIMNEGWATYWHTEIMTKKALKASELIDYADHASAVTASSGMQLNPYKLGVELLYHIEDRWNKGRFGREWEECDDMAALDAWDKRTGLGRQKLFEVREIYNDATFIDEFLTLDFCIEHKLFTFGFNKGHSRWEIMSRQFSEIKRQLLFQLTNMGNPTIMVTDGNHGNRGELLLTHQHVGIDLRLDWAQDVLGNIVSLWKRPAHIDTQAEKKPIRLSHDGTDFTKMEL